MRKNVAFCIRDNWPWDIEQKFWSLSYGSVGTDQCGDMSMLLAYFNVRIFCRSIWNI